MALFRFAEAETFGAEPQIIKQFKEGVYNVLVATSIGEEGLDIGEVDLIICYDSQKTPIRMVRFHISPPSLRILIPPPP